MVNGNRRRTLLPMMITAALEDLENAKGAA
jgi:hypothetical protein